MAKQAEPRPLTTWIDVRCSPAAAWEVVSDVRRTGEWSPECRRVIPLGALGAGALLVGVNRRGSVLWVTLSRVLNWSPGSSIGWLVLTNRSEWHYELTPTAEGTRITQTRRTPRGEGRFALVFTRFLLGGQAGHDDELERGMAQGLERIKAILEASPVDRTAHAASA